MSDSVENNISVKLMAFADGELGEEDARELLRHLAEHPEALATIGEHRKLTAAAERVEGGSAAEVPEHLRRKIEGMRQGQGARPEANPARRGWMVGLMGMAASVGLVAGVLVGRYGREVESPPRVLSEAPVVPASMVASVSRIHADCSRLADALHSAGFPESQGALAADVEQDLSIAAPHPDLRSAGYRYVGAGPCGETLPGTVHLLYRSEKPGSRNAVSLFVQTNDGRAHLQAGRLYSLGGPESPFPVMAWRTERVTYFVLADDERTIWYVLAAINGAPKQVAVP